ncbi:TIGR01841 family phasin [Thiomonas sp. FB-6]|uniref:phasin family protein n=1 Tax=Thiomonas sp. FB-6 TaxID=1158291 RepID=UPI0003829BEF
MMMTPEQMIAAQKSQLEALFALSGKAVDGFERMVELNLQTLKTALHEGSEATLAALSVKDLQEFSSLQPNLAQPLTEKALAYAQHVYEIASGTQAEFAKAVEANASEMNKKVQALVETATKNAPAGTETAVAMFKTAMSAANNAYDSLHKASKQAAEVVEANINTVTSTAMKAAQTNGGSRAKRAA